MSNQIKKLYQLLSYSNFVVLFSFFLPLSEKISTILIIFCIVMLWIEFYLGKVKLTFKRELYILPLLFIIFSISVFVFCEDIRLKWFEQRASLIAFPLIFMGRNNIDFKQTLKFFVFGCLMAYFICLFNSIFNSISFQNNELIFNPLLSDSHRFLEAIVHKGNYFFAEHFSMLIQTSYFGLYLTLAISIVITYRNSIFKKYSVVALVLILSLGVLQTMSIAAFGGLLVAIVILSFYLVKSVILRLIIYCLIIGLFVLGYFVQPRFRIMINDIVKSEIELNPEERYGVMLRFLSWDASLDIIRENPVLGVGVTNSQRELNQLYKEKGYIYPLKRKLNSHNQFLQIFIECGILGFIVIGAIFFFLFRKISKVLMEQKALILTFVILLLFNFLFESYFNRYIGISFVSFFYCLFISIEEKNKVYGTSC